jgi:transposase
MTHLEEITGDALREALWNVEDATAAIRLVAAIVYKQGVNQSEIGNWFGVTRRTIYNWLTRLESEPREVSEAACDDDRSGRSPRLSDQQQVQLEETLHNPPSEAGYDAPVWSPALVRQHIKETFEVEYSLSSCRRWLRKCGMSYKKPRRENTKADPEEREEFRE